MAMVFPTSPTVGQVFTSGGRSWVWNGSAWDSPAGQPFLVPGLTLVGSADFTGASTVFLDNVFSSTYKNYKVFISVSKSGNMTLSTRLRNSSGPITGAFYAFQNMASNTSSGVAFTNISNNRNQTSASLFSTDTFTGLTLDFFNPFESAITTWSGVGAQHLANMFASSGSYNSATSASGFELNTSTNTITGNVRVYGMRNN
jgi:hypothetical protein